jgi:hypothetical protein
MRRRAETERALLSTRQENSCGNIILNATGSVLLVQKEQPQQLQ